jgi:hypothetical protein
MSLFCSQKFTQQALVLYGLQQLCFTVCSVRAAYSTSRGHEFPRDVLAVYS